MVVTGKSANPHSNDLIGLMRNVIRLREDAQLLNEHGRHASAYALAILSLEELGKTLIKQWELPEPKSQRHIITQRAVAALLMGHWVGKEFGHLERLDDETVELAVEALRRSDVGQLSKYVEMTLLDKSKQLALYYDDGRINPDRDIGQDDVEKLLQTGRLALELVVYSAPAVEAGKPFFTLLTEWAARR